MNEEHLQNRLAELYYLLGKVNKRKVSSSIKSCIPVKDAIEKFIQEEKNKKTSPSKNDYAEITVNCDLNELFTYFCDVWFSFFKSNLKKEWNKYSVYISDEFVFFDSFKEHFFAEISFISNQTLVYYVNHIESKRAVINNTFFEEFNALYTLLSKRVKYISAFVTEILDSLVFDYLNIERTFGIDGFLLTEISIGLGDSHSKGKKVTIIKTSRGDLIFKPRENHEVNLYYDILSLINKFPSINAFNKGRPKILIGTNHSWHEYIKGYECISSKEVKDFYFAIGYQAAIMHALNGTDLHYENIIASGCSPYFVDLECILQPLKTAIHFNNKKICADNCFFDSLFNFEFSILSLGLFPKTSTPMMDNSGISMPHTTNVPRRKYNVENGKIIQKKEDVLFQRSSYNTPRLNGENISFHSYVDSITAGFSTGYLSIIERKTEIIDLLIKYKTSLRVRVLFKNTKRYFDLIKILRNPLFQRNKILSEILASSLCDDNPHINESDITDSEVKDVLNMDIPFFYAKPASLVIFDSRNKKTKFKLQMTPIHTAIKKIELMSKKNLAYQLRIITVSLSNDSSKFMNNEINVPIDKCEKDTLFRPQYFFDTSLKILEYIEMWSVRDNVNFIFWPMLYNDGGNITPSPMNTSLYNGAVGFGILYLSYYKITKDNKYLSVVAMIDSYIKWNAIDQADYNNIGGYFGIMPYIYFVANALVITKDEQYAKKLHLAIGKLPHIILKIKSKKLDFLDGISGALTILSNIYKRIDESKIVVKKIINNLLDILIDELSKTKRLELSMTGFAHGLSGIIFSLAKVYELFPSKNISQLINELLNAENELKEEGKWLDMRSEPFSVAPPKWCHGDAGILLTRNYLLSLNLDKETHKIASDDARVCLENILESGLDRGYSLCHGNLGNLICIHDSFIKTSPENAELAKVFFSSTINEFLKDNFLNKEKQIDLSLMTGLSGVCYSLLYFIDNGIPNVLTLELAKEG